MLLLILLLIFPSISYPNHHNNHIDHGNNNIDKLTFLTHHHSLTHQPTSSTFPNLIRHHHHRDRGQSNPETIQQLLHKLRKNKKRRFSEEKKINITWPLKRVAIIQGDVWLGGLMMVHEREEEIVCGPIMPQGGIQALETMLYTLDTINNLPSFLPSIKIATHILDDCDKDTYGLEQAVDFIKGSISTIDSSTCSDGFSPTNQKHNVISGVVGAASSVTSIQVANLLRLFKIPQVSFFSTSPELSNKQRFEYFSRTIPSDKNQVKVMVELLKTFGWTYVSIIYEESNYGIKAFEELEKLLPLANICIATKEKLVKDSGVAGDVAYERIVDKLVATGNAKGVIVFASDQEVKDLMRAVGRRNLTGHFSWIGSDGWSARSLVSEGNEAVVEGTLSVQPRANPVAGFDEYFFKLNPKTNLRNPWFVEFWEHHFTCKYPNSSKTPYNLDYKSFCTGDEKLDKFNTIFEDQLQYVSDAVLSFAYAVRDMHSVICNGTQGLCPRMNPIDGTELLAYLRKVKFHGLSGDSFHFDEFQDGPARYNIIHFRRKDAHSYHWIRVGDYNEGELSLNMSAIAFVGNESVPPVSVCSEDCLDGEAKQYFASDKCCWSCLRCLNYYVVNADSSDCTECPLGTTPNPSHTKCDPIREEYLRITDTPAIFSLTLSLSGIIITTIIITIFISKNDTPVVRASSRELSYVILIALLGCFCLAFLFVGRPTNTLCTTQLILTGFFFTLVYAALLTKTNRIARIFKAGRKSAKRPNFISPKSQLFICMGICLVQTLITTFWLLTTPPTATHFYPQRHDNFLICSSYVNHSYIVAFGYPLGVIFVCTVYAVLTRKIPGDFNESKCIGFTCYTTCIIWLAFVPIYFSTGQQVSLRITSLTIAISLSAFVMIVCLFGPKLYIIIFHPERNVRSNMMTEKSQRKVGMELSNLNSDKSTQMEDKKSNTIHPSSAIVHSSGTQTEANCGCESNLVHRFSFKKGIDVQFGSEEVVL